MRLSVPAVRSLTALATTFVVAAASAQVADGSFEQNVVPGMNQYQYSGFQPGPPTTPAGPFASPFTFGPGSGLIRGTGSAFNTPSPFPDGMQVAFLQGNGAFIEQSLTLTPGTYQLSFFRAGRSASGATTGNTTFDVTFGGLLVGSSATASFDQFTQDTFSFTTTGSGSLRFTNTSGRGDNTFFLDDVTLEQTATATPEPSTIVLVAGGLASLAAVSRRRRRA